MGGGSGGISCALAASKKGLSVIVFDYVEPSAQKSSWGLGGTCLNVGCIPKKLMHSAALQIEAIHQMEAFGIEGEYRGVSWERLRDNIQNYIKGMNFGYKGSLNQECTYANQMVRFLGREEESGRIRLEYSGSKEGLEVEEKKGEVTADYVVVAVGGRPNYLKEDICQNARQYAITSDDLFSLDKPPGKTLVVGGGYIAVESAGLLAGLGFQVDIMTRSLFLRSFDRQVVGYILDSLSGSQVEVMAGYLPYQIDKQTDGGLLVSYKQC